MNGFPFLLAAALAATAPVGAPVIRVDTISIGAEAVTRRAAALRAKNVRFDADQLVEALVDEAALAEGARRAGLDKDPGVAAAVEQEVARALAEAFVEHKVKAAVQPTEADLLAMYHDGADTVRLDLVVLASRQEAEQVKQRLAAGGDFALEAARSLDKRSGSNKGDTGPQTRAQLRGELATLAFSAPVGQLIGPVELELGFAVARIRERTLADPAGFAERRAPLEAMFRRQSVAAARKHLAEMYRARLKATVDTAFIDSLGNRVDATPAELGRTVATVGEEKLPYRLVLTKLRAVSGPAGHMRGPATKAQLAWSLVDERALARAGRDEGTAALPTVAIDLAAARTQALATAMAERIGAGEPARATAADREAAVRKRIKSLRRELTIEVDRKAAVAAAGAAR